MTPKQRSNPGIQPALGEIADALQQATCIVQETDAKLTQSSEVLDRLESTIKNIGSKLLQVNLLRWLTGEAADAEAFAGADWELNASDTPTQYGAHRRVPQQLRALMADAFQQMVQDNLALYTTEGSLFDGRYVATTKLDSEQRTLHGEVLRIDSRELVVWLGMISTPLDMSPSVESNEQV